jgi:hypothetical protein
MRPKNYRKSASQIFGTDVEFGTLEDDDVLQYSADEDKYMITRITIDGGSP